MALGYFLQGPLRIAIFDDDAVLFHAPSASLLLVTPPLATLLDALTQAPTPTAELLAQLTPEDAAEAAVQLKRLAQEGFIGEVKGPA